MENKRVLSWKKIRLMVIASALAILAVNAIIWKAADENATRIDSVYGSNVSLNDLSDKLQQVQESMESYLDTKTSDSMEAYYSAAEQYNSVVGDLDNLVSSNQSHLMEKNIKGISETYLKVADETVEAKRSRNVEKYKEKYEETQKLYGYIRTYIYSLNNEQFQFNSVKYNSMIGTFRLSEIISMLILVVVIILILVTLASVIGRLTASEELREKMVVDGLVKEREHEMESNIKDAKLKYFQSQIHPHFLFNTLNAGAQLSMLEDAPRSYEYLQNLSEFFRYNLKNNEEVTLADELDLVDHYIYILNVRFAGEIHFSKQIDEELLDYRMPGMILQPIIENSVNYGIRNNDGEKKIELEVTSMDDLIVISIRDNGVGISQEKIDKIMAGEKVESDHIDSNGVGLVNVISRLKLYYGVEEVLAIQSTQEQRGTEVILYLPRR